MFTEFILLIAMAGEGEALNQQCMNYITKIHVAKRPFDIKLVTL